jgi:Secretion system C-terminal sorting domain
LPFHDGWNLFGNPYPSPIDWDLLALPSEIIDVAYVPEVVNGVTVFRTWDKSSQLGGLTGGSIALGQAFWVRATAAGASLTITESAKGSSGTFYRKSSSDIPSLEVTLSRDGVSDAAFLLLNPEATTGYDVEADAFKLNGDEIGISLLSDEGYGLVYYATNNVEEKEIELNILANTPGDYSLDFATARGNKHFEHLVLIDRFIGVSKPLLESEPYIFQVSKNEASKNGRFYISSRPPKDMDMGIRLVAFPNPTNSVMTIEMPSKEDVLVGVYSAVGTKIEEVKLSAHGGLAWGIMDLSNQANGMYIIRVDVGSKQQVLKVFKR